MVKSNMVSRFAMSVVAAGLFAVTILSLLGQFLPVTPWRNVTTFETTKTRTSRGQLGLSERAGVRFQGRTLHGRFLHITDFHPDPDYKPGTLLAEFCHRGHKGHVTSKYGVATGGCDASLELMHGTLRWIKEHLRDEIDFVIWTGDNMKHDQDRQLPRSEMQIFDMNREMAELWYDLVRSRDSPDPRDLDVPVVPSIGNNDVFPHNLYALGPTLQTRELYNIWQRFVPQEQANVFARGAFFFVEVIPGRLAVLSINTLYLFKSNPLVDNCDSKKQPGYQLLLWLGRVLEEMRVRGIKVWLSGHVPPIPKNYDSSCFGKFSRWTYEYRDVIVGGVYGHMNMDHFVPVHAREAYASAASGAESHAEGDSDAEASLDGFRSYGAAPVGKESYMEGVREIYSRVAGELSDADLHEYASEHFLVQISGSVIPTFNPSFRVWEYNISGLEDVGVLEHRPWAQVLAEIEAEMDLALAEDTVEGLGKVDNSVPRPMPVGTELGPGYVPQLFSPTRYVQYFANLTQINAVTDSDPHDNFDHIDEDIREGRFKYEVEYTSDNVLRGLLVKDYLEYAAKLGGTVSDAYDADEASDADDANSELEFSAQRKKGKKGKGKGKSKKGKGKNKKKHSRKSQKLWEEFLFRAFISTGYRDE